MSTHTCIKPAMTVTYLPVSRSMSVITQPCTGDTERSFKQSDLSATVQLSNHHNRVTIGVCDEVTGPFVLCLSLCSLQVVCFHVKHYLLQ